MDRDQAVQEVHEIKQVMEESRRRSSRGKCWIIVAAALLTMESPASHLLWLRPSALV
jgi:hypothetical protein